MKVAIEVDAGDIIMQQQVKINNEYYLELEENFALLGGDMISKVIEQFKDTNLMYIFSDLAVYQILKEFNITKKG